MDTHTTIEKQFEMMNTILHFHKQSLSAIENGADTSEIFKLPVREDIARAKYIEENNRQRIIDMRKTIDEQIKELIIPKG